MSDSSSSIRMICAFDGCMFQDYTCDIVSGDFFYDWFEGKLDLDEDDQFIAESLDQSPRSDHGSWMSVRVAQDEYNSPELQGQDTFIILDSGSDVSLLPRDYVPDAGHRLKDCQGNPLDCCQGY